MISKVICKNGSIHYENVEIIRKFSNFLHEVLSDTYCRATIIYTVYTVIMRDNMKLTLIVIRVDTVKITYIQILRDIVILTYAAILKDTQTLIYVVTLKYTVILDRRWRDGQAYTNQRQYIIWPYLFIIPIIMYIEYFGYLQPYPREALTLLSYRT